MATMPTPTPSVDPSAVKAIRRFNRFYPRRIYAKRGFQLVHSEPHEGYGQPQVGETWELKL